MTNDGVQRQSGPQTPDLTVFFDGACPLCRTEINVYRGCQGAERVAFVDVAETVGGDVAPGLTHKQALARFHVLTRDGTLASGAEGFGQLWLMLPGWRRLGQFVMLPVVRQLAELTYRIFLQIRPALQWVVRRGARLRTSLR